MTSTSTPSSKSPQTPDYSSQSTPFTPLLRRRRPIEPFQTPPLYSKSEQLSFHQQKTTLEMELTTLKQRHQALIAEYKKVKENIVSQGELLCLKAQVCSRMEESHSSELQNKLDEYIEVLHENKQLEATISNLSSQINDTIACRNEIIKESNLIADAHDFSSLEMKLPNCPPLELAINSTTTLSISRSLQKLQGLKEEISSLDLIKPPIKLQVEAASFYSQCAEARWQLKSLGTNHIRAVLQDLRKELTDSDSDIHKFENSIQSDRLKLEEINTRNHATEAQANADAESNIENFKNQTNHITSLLEKLQINVIKTREAYSKIQADVESLESRYEELNRFERLEPQEQEEEDETDTETSVLSENSTEEIDLMNINSQLEQRLLNQKSELLQNINEMKKELHDSKISLKQKQSALKSEVQALYSKYLENKQMIGKLKSKNGICPSPVDKEIASLMRNIDSNINELRSSFIDD